MKAETEKCAAALVTLLLAAGSLFAQPQQQSGANRTSAKPNIVLFLIDDLGWTDLGLTGSAFYDTPHVDALAKEGVFFSNAYTASPVCSPTRASILTGKYPSRIGLTNYSGTTGPQGPKYRLTPPALVGHMPPGDTTLAEALKEAGYTTGHIGKWHLAKHTDKDRATYPENNGFDLNIAGHKGGHPNSFYFPYKGKKHPGYDVPDLDDGIEGDYLTDVLTDRAIDFIEQNKNKPFFLNLWYYTVHTPIQPRKDKLEKYRKKARDMGLETTSREAKPEGRSFTDVQQDNAAYAAMVESMDENIGRILDTLKRLDLENDTMVVFFSDNGGLSTGGKRMPTSNLPLRAGKAWLYEGGIRVPLIVRFPGGIRAGQKINQPVVSTDLYPTILEMTGLPLRPKQHVDGVSLKPLVTGEQESLDREAIYFHYPHYHSVNTMGPAGAVRMGDFKLIEIFETGKVELYNLRDDIGETRDLAEEMPELAAKMKKMLHRWRKNSGAAMPTRNPEFKDRSTATRETLPPLQRDVAPQTFDEMWRGFDPRTEPLDVEVLKEWEQDGVVLNILRYRIGVFKGQKAMMAAVYGYPKGGTNLPGLVQIHGGGQYASYQAVLTNAKRGYATISIAWAGRISAPKYRVGPNEVKLFWENKTSDPAYKITTDWGALDAYHAPSKHAGPNAFVSIPTAEWTLDAVKSPRNNSWFLCALGARRALTFLEQQPQVDGDRLGVYGHSMGGKLTVLTAAADARVKAAAPSCGGISDRYNRDQLHRNTVGDAPNLSRIKCPIVFLSPANDFHGHINNLVDAVDEIQTPDWRVTCSPHLNHRDRPEFEVATQLWFDQYLKSSFTWPATPETSLNLKNEHGVPAFSVKPDTTKPVLGVDIYFCQQGHDDGEGKHHENRIARFWHHAAAAGRGDTWAAHLPLFSNDKPLWVYANVLYPLEEPIQGAGYYYGSYSTETFNVSSLIKIVRPEELQAAGVKPVVKPLRMIETFQGDWEKEWFSYTPSGWACRTHKIYHPRWAAPHGAKLLLDVRAAEANTLVVGIDQFAAEAKLSGGTKWETITLATADFQDASGGAMTGWEDIKELRLQDADHLRAKKRGDKTVRRVGARWKGAPPKFRNLRWAGGKDVRQATDEDTRVGRALLPDHTETGKSARPTIGGNTRSASALLNQQSDNKQTAEAKRKEPKKQPALDIDITLQPGFVIERVFDVPPEMGSWVSLTVGPQGRLYASDQERKGIFRITVPKDAVGSDLPGSVVVEKIPVDLSGAQGLCWAFDSLFAVVNGRDGGLYRLTDTNADDLLDKKEHLIRLSGGGEHGPHAVILAPDRKSLYLCGGNHTKPPSGAKSRVPSNWNEDLLLPRRWDGRGHAAGILAPGGWVANYDPESGDCAIHSIGHRNQYDIAFNANGDLFTYDSDMEWDLGTPWYRPTRICHLTSGSEFGWRSGSGKWPTYYKDSLPPVLNIGPGSPVGVLFGYGTKFPAKYQQALFVLDWTFGTIYAIHLTPEGSTYRAEKEDFLVGTPLPVTDATVGHDGALYFTTGGRRIGGDLFRVRYEGDQPTNPVAYVDSRHDSNRQMRKRLEAMHAFAGHPAAFNQQLVLRQLENSDRFIQYAARIALEHHAGGDGSKITSLLNADGLSIDARLMLCMAAARTNDKSQLNNVLQALQTIPLDDSLTAQQALTLFRCYQLSAIRLGPLSDKQAADLLQRFDDLYPHKSLQVNRELVQWLVYLKSPTVVAKTLDLMDSLPQEPIPDWGHFVKRGRGYGGTIGRVLSAMPPTTEIHFGFVLRTATEGWNLPLRRRYFQRFPEWAKKTGGASFALFLGQFREDAIATCSPADRLILDELISSKLSGPARKIHPIRGPGRQWTVEEMMTVLKSQPLKKLNFDQGSNLFHAANCAKCHRFANEGSSIGPDLSTVANKFKIRDLVDALVTPSKAISDQYGSHQVITQDGRSLVGRVVQLDDKVLVYPIEADGRVIEFSADEIDEIMESKISQMPVGLADGMNPDEVRQLIGYLLSGGNKRSKYYRP